MRRKAVKARTELGQHTECAPLHLSARRRMMRSSNYGNEEVVGSGQGATTDEAVAEDDDDDDNSYNARTAAVPFSNEKTIFIF